MTYFNKRERKIYEDLIYDGWKVFHKGFPDFLCFKDGKVKFIEVKKMSYKFSWKKGLSKHQREVIGLLRKYGFDVEVIYV